MALPPNASNEAFLREVDENLRRDQLASFWERYGRLLIGAILVGLLLFGAFLFWQHRREVRAGEQGEKLQTAYDALGAENPAEAEKQIAELARSGNEGYRALAMFTQGDILLGRNDLKGAAAKFASIARDESMAQPFRDLALVRQTAAEFDDLQPQLVIDRLRPLATPANAYFGSAGEMLAIAYLRSGRRDLAARTFQQIGQDANVPETIRQRAVQMAGTMGADASQAPSKDAKTR